MLVFEVTWVALQARGAVRPTLGREVSGASGTGGRYGADPGLVTMMLSDVDKQIGVILFVNTAIRQEDGEAYGAIFDDLWQLGVHLKRARAN